ncbi:MAG: hypothetical protein AAF515_12965 [Pseudomonadota bacterium]
MPVNSVALFATVLNPVIEAGSEPSLTYGRSGRLQLYYTNPEGAIVLRTVGSIGVLSWRTPADTVGADGVVFTGNQDGWDKRVGDADVIAVGDELWMLYTGYDPADETPTLPASRQIGLAISADNGRSFVRHSSSLDGPLIGLSADSESPWRDSLRAPSIEIVDGMFHLTFSGWNRTIDADRPQIIGATSADGVAWDYLADPLLTPLASWAVDIQQADLHYDSEEANWHLVYANGYGIGAVRASAFTGPYTQPALPLGGSGLFPLDGTFFGAEAPTWLPGTLMSPTAVIGDATLLPDTDRALLILFGAQREGSPETSIGALERGLTF